MRARKLGRMVGGGVGRSTFGDGGVGEILVGGSGVFDLKMLEGRSFNNGCPIPMGMWILRMRRMKCYTTG